MRSDKDDAAGRTVGSYNLRDVLAQADDADRPPQAAVPPTIPLDMHHEAVATPPVADTAPEVVADADSSLPPASDIAKPRDRHDVPMLPPKGITYTATGAVAGLAALALTHALAPKKPKVMARKLVPSVNMSAYRPANDLGSGPLVSTLASLSKTVLAGSSQLPPPTVLDGAEPARVSAPLGLSDVIRIRASNVVTGNGGLEASWPIEMLTPGIELPNGKILIEGLPGAARLNHGWLRTDGRWTLAPDELPGLTVRVPAAFARATVIVSLANGNDAPIAQAEAIVEPVPQPEAAAAPARPDAIEQERFGAFFDKWKRYNGRSHLTGAEKAALFAEFRTIVDSGNLGR